MRFSRVELVFIAFGAGLGAVVAYLSKAGLVATSQAFPPFVFVLLGLGLAEIVAGLALRSPPGSLIAMPARLLAFAIGVGVLALLAGGLA
ncbi:hypothetical protein [Bosea sp. PAMC 26642]|uniref:hypothetical protein n=1 Tax=Bosea sp. (strain PAMC 26642) TaxID=1792307 RepID=UPI000770377C|nr:hypothetical protein [Bosea sp. PAMC 26642]AMJ59069.1 hypothetical protein AXW83_01045 [Bosea sp. PAMC 26642]